MVLSTCCSIVLCLIVCSFGISVAFRACLFHSTMPDSVQFWAFRAGPHLKTSSYFPFMAVVFLHSSASRQTLGWIPPFSCLETIHTFHSFALLPPSLPHSFIPPSLPPSLVSSSFPRSLDPSLPSPLPPSLLPFLSPHAELPTSLPTLPTKCTPL